MQVTLKAKQVKDSVTHTPGVCLWKLLGLGDSCAFQSLLCREIFATLPYFEKRELLGIQREHFPLATSSQAFLFCFSWGLVICSGCSFFISCGNSVALPVDQTSSKLAKIITLMIKWMPWFLYFVFLKLLFFLSHPEEIFVHSALFWEPLICGQLPACLWGVLLFQKCNSSASNRYHQALRA